MKALVALFATWPGMMHAADPHPQGTQIVVMVVQVSSLAEFVAKGDQGAVAQLHANGITDDVIADSSVAAGIVYCCGGKISNDTMVIFYVPPILQVVVGDVAEISVGRNPTKKQLKSGAVGIINRALRVRESFEDEIGACRWEPENDTLWMRVLHCDWMLAEGWEYRKGLSKGWYKPPGPQ